DICEILLHLSSNFFSTNSLHEQLRLLNVFSLFLNNILLNSLDNDYLHSILRDSTYILLRYIEQNSQKKYLKIYQQELNDKILNIICKLLHQLCIKGLDFDSLIYLHHIPDIVSTLINYDQHLTKEPGKCLSKCSLLLINNNQENLEDDQYEQIPLWIIDDLIMFYLIDKEQSIVECTRYTLKTILNHSIGQELYQKYIKNDLIQIYSKPILSQINFSLKIQTNLNSSLNPWLITSFDIWFISLINYLLKQIEYYYIEKKEIGHPYAFIFIQLKQLVQLKIELAKKLFPHLIYCLLLLPINLNIRQLLTNNFTCLLEQLFDNKCENNITYIQIAKIV
ncbi:unnamed protein product, partial [Rotaria sp. Silwood2]